MFSSTLTTSDSAFITAAVQKITDVIAAAIEDHGTACVGLSGGSTPVPVYEALAQVQQIDWNKVTFFLVDERYCDAMSADSNQKMIAESFETQAARLKLVVPNTSLPIDECIAKYAQDLKALWKNRLPDLMILGMGDDGHIASLFPPVSDDALSDAQLVLHTTTDRFAVHDRISISLNAICAAGQQLFLLKGESKKKVWDEMLGSKEDEKRWPAKRVLETGDVSVIAMW
jgi:6-phosphogluconolactonase